MDWALQSMLFLHAFAVGLIALSVVCGLTAALIGLTAVCEWLADRL